MIAIVLLVASFAALVGANSALYREVRRLRLLNKALLDGAARRLANDIRPQLAAALDRIGTVEP